MGLVFCPRRVYTLPGIPFFFNDLGDLAVFSVKEESKEVLRFLTGFLKWVLVALITGAVGGLVGSAFHLSVSHATAFRAAHPWLLYLLPAAGLVIGLIYHLLHTENKNTNTIIDAIHLGDRVPLALPRERLDIEIVGSGADPRTVRLTPHGTSYEGLVKAL